tara:strand:+ start:1245 stop:1367 length:123 start_codon:yes stop_codon:yes gene_type:complete
MSELLMLHKLTPSWANLLLNRLMEHHLQDRRGTVKNLFLG